MLPLRVAVIVERNAPRILLAEGLPRFPASLRISSLRSLLLKHVGLIVLLLIAPATSPAQTSTASIEYVYDD